jgi:hypothetical protein
MDVTAKLLNWMIDFVEVPNPNLGGWAPCPYAKQARINDKISIRFSNDLINEVPKCLPDLETKDVVVICFDHTIINANEIEQLVSNLNKTLLVNDYVILEDHPDQIENVNGVRMNFGECGLLIIQRLSKLNASSALLKDKGYYQVWDQPSLDYVVSWRSND